MKVSIFGGTGFVGSRVVKNLVQNGHELKALARNQAKASFLNRLGASTVIGDLNEPETIRDAIKGSEVIVNLALPDARGWMGKGRAGKINRQLLPMTKNLLEAAAEAGGIPVIITEGTPAYGDNGDNWIDESTPYNPTGYARLGELTIPYTQRIVKEKSQPIIKMLLGGIYGAGGWFMDIYGMMKKGWFRVFGDGQNIFSYVHVDDVAEAYRMAVEKLPVGESFIIVDDEPCKTIDFGNQAVECMGRKTPVKSMPKWIANILAGSIVVETLTMNCRAKNSKAKEMLGWRLKYPSYRDGVPAAVTEIEKHLD